MLAADKQSDSTGSGKAHCPSDPASTWGPVAAKGSSQVVEPGAFSLLSCLCPTEPAYWGLWGLQCFSSPFQLMSGLLPTSHPPRVLTSAVFPATQRLWLHTESCAVSWRPTPIVEFPQLGFFGNCKATGRSQLVRHSENVRKEVPAPPTLSRVPLKGTGRHGVSTNRTLTQPRSVLAAGGSHLTHFTPDFPV